MSAPPIRIKVGPPGGEDGVAVSAICETSDGDYAIVEMIVETSGAANSWVPRVAAALREWYSWQDRS